LARGPRPPGDRRGKATVLRPAGGCRTRDVLPTVLAGARSLPADGPQRAARSLGEPARRGATALVWRGGRPVAGLAAARRAERRRRGALPAIRQLRGLDL